MATVQNPEKAISHSLSYTVRVPTEQGDKTVTNSSARLFNNATDPSSKCSRQIMIQNIDGAATLGIHYNNVGDSTSGVTLSQCVRIQPNGVFEDTIGANIQVIAVSSAASQSANVRVDDKGQ